MGKTAENETSTAKTLRQRSKMRREKREKKLKNERKYLLESVIDEEMKIEKEKEKIKEKIQKLTGKGVSSRKKRNKMNSELSAKQIKIEKEAMPTLTEQTLQKFES